MKHNTRGAMSILAGFIVVVLGALLVLYLISGTGAQAKEKSQTFTAQMKKDAKQAYYGQNPELATCRRWIAEGLALPQTLNVYGVPEKFDDPDKFKENVRSCCKKISDNEAVTMESVKGCFDLCLALVRKVEGCTSHYEYLKDEDGKYYTSPGLCYAYETQRALKEYTC